MTILRKCAVLVAASGLVALAVPTALADYEPGLNPELEIPSGIDATYDGPALPNALLARYVRFPANWQKRQLSETPRPDDPPNEGNQDRVNSATGPDISIRAERARSGQAAAKGSAVGIGGSLLTPQPGAIQPKSRMIIDDLEDALRDAQSELGLR